MATTAAVRPGRVSRLATGRGRLAGAAIMVACGVVCVLDASGVLLKIVTGVLMAGAEAGIVGARLTAPGRLSAIAVMVPVAAGLAVTLLVPGGLGEVPVLVGVATLPVYLAPGRMRAAAITVASVAFGVSIMVISRSWVGLLSGAGAWALADRSVEHAAFQAERDRALALLAQVEASRDAQREAAAAEERNRIAREMHDVLAHSLAGLSMQLQAVRAVAAREGAPASITGPVDRAAELARDGVQEARAAVGALRATGLRGAADLERLVEGFPAETTWQVAGPPGRLSPEAGHAVYRAAQEAMTNTARYATGSRIDVRADWGTEQLAVRVRDYGLPAGQQASGERGGGTGITSMTARVEAAGGTLIAGPAPDGPGWRVEARVPVTREADA